MDDVLLLRALALVSMLAAFAPSSQAAPDPWKALYRPLQVPRLAAGTPCRVSSVDPTVDFAGFGVGAGLGRGPAYPVGIADGTLDLAPARNFGSRRWMGQKVLWFVHPRYAGPVLIRGRQLDGRYRVRFEQRGVPPLELRIGPRESVTWTGQPRGSRGRPSYTRLRTPGCYAYQIDGTTFSRVIVFRAKRAR